MMRKTLAELQDLWSPEIRPVHCSNCSHAGVTGARGDDEADSPIVKCSESHGEPTSLLRLIRPERPFGFRNASKCVDFDSMSKE